MSIGSNIMNYTKKLGKQKRNTNKKKKKGKRKLKNGNS